MYIYIYKGPSVFLPKCPLSVSITPPKKFLCYS